MQLRYNVDIEEIFSTELRNHFNELNNEHSSATSQYDEFVKPKDIVMAKTLTTIQKCHQKILATPRFSREERKVDNLTNI